MYMYLTQEWVRALHSPSYSYLGAYLGVGAYPGYYGMDIHTLSMSYHSTGQLISLFSKQSSPLYKAITDHLISINISFRYLLATIG